MIVLGVNLPQRYLIPAISLAFVLLWLLVTGMIWANWRSESLRLHEEIQHEAGLQLRGKASEIGGILQRTYHTIRTISLFPGVRSAQPYNRNSDEDDVVKTGRLSQTDYDTVQQLYNHIAASVAVSEIYIIFDPFSPNDGQIPFLTFDQVIVDRFDRLTANVRKDSSDDIPEEDESEEYAEYVRQLAFLREHHPLLPSTGLDGIISVHSGLLRTCDNSQYTSKKHGDIRNTLGFTLSVPIYDLSSRRFKGLVTAILRKNVIEAALLGWPVLPATNAEKEALQHKLGADSINRVSNYLLENQNSGIRIFDTRNPHWAALQSNPPALYPMQTNLDLPGMPGWVLHNYVSQEILDNKLNQPAQRAIIQVALASLALGLLWLAVIVMLRLQSKATEQLKIAAATFETHDAIMIMDADANIIRVNQAFEKITGYSPEDVLGKNPRILSSGRHDEDFFAGMWQAVLSDGAWSGEVWDTHKSGNIYPKQLTITAVKNVAGETTQYVAIFDDISERKKTEEEIHRLAFYDALTELPNRRLLLDRLGLALSVSARNQQYGALLFLDLDNFKILNDTLGHGYGDMLLVEVANRIKFHVRETDTVARFGGDEFVVLIENISADADDASQSIAHVAEKIRAALATPYLLKKNTYQSSPSIGVCLFFGNNESVDELIKRADMAMYQAKDAGRNRVRFFDPHMQQLMETRVALESDLRDALLDHQLRLFYQIQLDRDQRPIGAEALVRWIHPKRGIVSPADFIPIAEESSLILNVGHWVLDAACQQLALWSNNEQTRDLVLAVNISAKQFKQPDFVEQIVAIIHKHRIEPSRLKLELTESVVLDDIDVVVEKMLALRQVVGVTLSLDDFGTGYSSLSYLKRLPLDQIKVDQSFVRDMTTNDSDAVMVKAIINLALNFGLDVIAEGVETEAQLAFLKKNGCLTYQGYLFSKPVPIEQFEALLKQG